MKNLPYLGPSLVVLAAGAFALVVAPMSVRRANDARATAEIAQASRILEQGADITPVGYARQAGDALAQEGARDPLDDSLRVRTSPPPNQPSSSGWNAISMPRMAERGRRAPRASSGRRP